MGKMNRSKSALPDDKTYLQKEMNLLPGRCGERRARLLKRLPVAAAALLLVACLSVHGLHLERAIVRKQAESDRLKESIADLSETQNGQHLLEHLDNRIQAKSAVIKSFESATPKITPVLNILEKHLPLGIVFSSLNKTETELMIAGRADTQQTVAEYLHNLRSEPVFHSVVVRSITKNPETRTGSGYTFNIQCRFTPKGGETRDVH